MRSQHVLITFVFFFSTISVLAKTTAKSGTNTKAAKVVYGSAPWNKDSKSLDQAFMFVREKSTGKTAKILLEETEPDSSIFSGQFAIDFKSDHPSAIEMYIPPENMRDDEKSITRFNQLLNEKKVRPAPMVVKDENGVKVYDVYDTAEQARRARQAYEKQVRKTHETERSKNIKPVPSEQALDAAQMAEKERILAELAKAAAAREAERIRLEQLEAQRLERMRKERARLDDVERQRRMREARSWAEKGVAAYQRGDYKSAEAAFTKSVELDPDNKDYYFMYGVALYRNERLNEALVALKIAPATAATDLERQYYIGLIHYRLQEYPAALAQFRKIKGAKHDVLSPSAAFYEGIVLFSQDELESAQAAFEWVLDNSKDPALDKKAEEYIEKIAVAMQVRKEAARKWQINASAGVTYDSNILYAPDNDTTQGTAKDDGGLRLMLTGTADYRLHYSLARELSIKANTLYIYSLDDEFATSDPFLVTTGLPYTLKGTLGKRGYKLTVTPGYETLFMDAENEGLRKNIMNSFMGNADLMLIMRDNYFAGYSIEVRKDNSSLASAQGDDDLTAMKYSFKTQHIHLLDSSKKRALILSAGLSLNDAEGRNKAYNRIDAGAMYSAPWNKFKDTSWNSGVNWYRQDYPDALEDRTDTNLGLMAGLNKAINKSWGWGLSGTYNNNASSNSNNQYSKYTVLSTLNYNWTQ